MVHRAHDIGVLPDRLAVARLDGARPLPAPPPGGGLWSAVRTASEISIITAEGHEPDGAVVERGFRCLAVRGPLAFDEVGVLAALAGPLASAGVSLLAVSTFDTDYLLVRDGDLSRAVEALRRAGHRVEEEGLA